MRLLHVSHQYRPAIGGAEHYITRLSEEMVRRGHKVDVFTSRSLDYRSWRNELPAEEWLDGVRVRRFRSLRRPSPMWRLLHESYIRYFGSRARRYEPLIWLGNGPVSPTMFVEILRRAPDYDLIHINNLHYAHAALAAKAAAARGLPIVVTPHLHVEQPVTYDVGYMRRLLRRSDALIADTTGEKHFLLSQGWDRDVVVGGVGVDLDEFPPRAQWQAREHFGLPPGSFVILFLGRKTEYKGLDLCLEAFSALRRERDDIYFLALGPETDYSRRLWQAHGPQEGLIVRDRVSDEERLLALAACDVLALPSTGEAFGIVFLEAWAYSRPVIGARIASVSSLVTEGEDGYLIEPGDSRELTCRLGWLAANPEAGARAGAAGRRTLERRYTWPRIGDIVEATYARVLRRRRTLG